MKLQITLKVDCGDDFVGPIVSTSSWNADMKDHSVYAWLKVFNSVLDAAGFNKTIIMRGACQLAFNDCRDLQTMKKLAEEYDLTNWSDVND